MNKKNLSDIPFLNDFSYISHFDRSILLYVLSYYATVYLPNK